MRKPLSFSPSTPCARAQHTLSTPLISIPRHPTILSLSHTASLPLPYPIPSSPFKTVIHSLGDPTIATTPAAVVGLAPVPINFRATATIHGREAVLTVEQQHTAAPAVLAGMGPPPAPPPLTRFAVRWDGDGGGGGGGTATFTGSTPSAPCASLAIYLGAPAAARGMDAFGLSDPVVAAALVNRWAVYHGMDAFGLSDPVVAAALVNRWAVYHQPSAAAVVSTPPRPRWARPPPSSPLAAAATTPPRPKGRGAYNAFAAHHRPRLAAANPGWTANDVERALGSTWAGLPNEDKVGWVEAVVAAAARATVVEDGGEEGNSNDSSASITGEEVEGEEEEKEKE